MSAHPPGWTDEKASMGQAPPPPYSPYPGYQPQPGEGYPQPCPGYQPQPGEAYPPQPGPGYQLKPGEAYQPQPGPGYQPQPGEAYPPQPGPGYPPQPQGYGPMPQYGEAGYGQQQYPGQPGVVNVQPTVYVSRGPLANPVKDYLAYSIFTMLCCCLPLGIAALIYSISRHQTVLYFPKCQLFIRAQLLLAVDEHPDCKWRGSLHCEAMINTSCPEESAGCNNNVIYHQQSSAHDANHDGDQMKAERSSRTARTLNHVALGIGIGFLIFTIIRVVVMIH
ncbi:hypothetical protein PAMA_014845 [Pampus argenteus]